jgi:cell fate regulator YaaT (PSP1 superfamily)
MTSFFFVSENPVDFRELLKKMIQGFKGRIHLERVSPRQRTKIIGGIGSCGRTDCCQFQSFNTKKVSLDAVRDQGIMINNNPKIFGLHNKIKTCFLYELAGYRKNRRYLPHIRQEVLIKKQKGRVIGLDILNLKVKVFLENDTIETFPVADIEYENKREAPKDPELNFDKYNLDIEGDTVC